jgi:hypothetical protein
MRQTAHMQPTLSSQQCSFVPFMYRVHVNRPNIITSQPNQVEVPVYYSFKLPTLPILSMVRLLCGVLCQVKFFLLIEYLVSPIIASFDYIFQGYNVKLY